MSQPIGAYNVSAPPSRRRRPSSYQFRGDNPDNSDAEMVISDRKMKKVVITDKKMTLVM
jgi:hypothetical protein